MTNYSPRNTWKYSWIFEKSSFLFLQQCKETRRSGSLFKIEYIDMVKQISPSCDYPSVSKPYCSRKSIIWTWEFYERSIETVRLYLLKHPARIIPLSFSRGFPLVPVDQSKFKENKACLVSISDKSRWRLSKVTENYRLSSRKHNEESKMDTEETLYNTNNNDTVIEGVAFNCLFKKFYKGLQYIYRETRTATKNRRCRKSDTTFTFDYRFDMAESSGYQDMNAGFPCTLP